MRVEKSKNTISLSPANWETMAPFLMIRRGKVKDDKKVWIQAWDSVQHTINLDDLDKLIEALSELRSQVDE